MLINQWLPAAHAGDAIGDSAREVRGHLRRLGHSSEIYAITIDDTLAGDVRPLVDPQAARGDLTILHFGLASPMTDAFGALPGGRILQYHNITPAHFFAPFDANLYRLASQGRRDLAALAGRVDLALGDSEYNRRELEELGFASTAVFPVAIPLRRLTAARSCPALEAAFDDEFDNVLFVGRIVPNKRVEDHVRLAAWYAREIGGECRFVFVGRYDGVPRYYSAVRALIDRCGLPRDRFVFTGPLGDDELAACYRTADVYLSMSEHEGFCVPLVEAMAMDVPVLAHAAAAVPETLGGAGVQFSPKDFSAAAHLLDVLLHDEAVRERVLDGQRRRVAAFGEEATSARVAEMVEKAAS
jgi:glycosyltransferase involved in cell wall biosynthesis